MKILQSFARVGHMLRKEFIQTLRDPHTRFLLIGPPIIQMLVFGYAATMEVKHVGLAVLDLDNTQESRELVSHFSASRYFDLEKYARQRDELREGIDRGDFLVALEMSADRQRAKTDSPIRVTGWPRSSALKTVHLPVPFWPAVSRILSTIGCPSSSCLAKMWLEISIR